MRVPGLQHYKNQSEDFYSSLVAGEKIWESIETFDIHFVMTKVKLKLDKRKSELQARSKTNQLWLNVQKLLNVARALIKADHNFMADALEHCVLTCCWLLTKSYLLFLENLLSSVKWTTGWIFCPYHWCV